MNARVSFLIVGTQRTGSSAIAEQIGLHPEITCGWESTNHLLPFSKLRVAEQIFSGDFRNLDAKERAYLEGIHHDGKKAIGFRRLFRSSAKWLVSPAWAPALWVDRLEAHLRWLGRARPQTHIIHVTRSDNVAWLRSMGLARSTDRYVGQAYPDGSVARWSLRQAQRRVQTKHWVGARLATLRHSNPYINVSYEAFRDCNVREIGRVIDFLGFEPRPDIVASAHIRPQSKPTGDTQLQNADAIARLLDELQIRFEPLYQPAAR
ncbi:MAG: sulfotransferase [Pseudomonadales bacterium]